MRRPRVEQLARLRVIGVGLGGLSLGVNQRPTHFSALLLRHDGQLTFSSGGVNTHPKGQGDNLDGNTLVSFTATAAAHVNLFVTIMTLLGISQPGIMVSKELDGLTIGFISTHLST